MWLLRIHKGPLNPLRAPEIGRKQRCGEEREEQLAQRERVGNRGKGKGFYRQQKRDQQPDNVVLRYPFPPFKEGDGQPQRVLPHGDRKG